MNGKNTNICTPCTTCEIRECKKNRNPQPPKSGKTLIEKLKEKAEFEKCGCPHSCGRE